MRFYLVDAFAKQPYRGNVAGGRSALFCAQSRPGDRSGLVRALVEATRQGYRVRIGGQCFTTLTGELRIPPA